jgi:hypothetical protein
VSPVEVTAEQRRIVLDELARNLSASGKLRAIVDACTSMLDTCTVGVTSSEAVGRLEDARAWAQSMLSRAEMIGGAR